jgi:hypothetical protein
LTTEETANSTALSSDVPHTRESDGAVIQATPSAPAVSGHDFEQAYSEPLERTLNLDTWHAGADLMQLYDRLEREVADAVRQESRIHAQIREIVFPHLRTRPGAPEGAGVYAATMTEIERVHRQLLFNGGVEACDGTVVAHDTLPVTITQIGVCLVSYHAEQGCWVHRLFRRDLRAAGSNPVDETMDLLDRRRQRGAQDVPSMRDRLSDLARRGIMAYAERAVLLDRSDAVWRMGHGSPTPYELVTGSGMIELLRAGLDVMRRLVLDHRRFVYVPSATSARELLTIGNALHPLEYAIVGTNEDTLSRIAEQGHYRGEGWGEEVDAVKKFVKECGPKVVVGMYRASTLAPAQMFYAHADHAHEAALIAIADSALQEHRGFPMLIDLADGLCSATFGADWFAASTRLAYAHAGEPFRYMAERKTRG